MKSGRLHVCNILEQVSFKFTFKSINIGTYLDLRRELIPCLLCRAGEGPVAGNREKAGWLDQLPLVVGSEVSCRLVLLYEAVQVLGLTSAEDLVCD